jgi:hypothetical protein
LKAFHPFATMTTRDTTSLASLDHDRPVALDEVRFGMLKTHRNWPMHEPLLVARPTQTLHER